MIQAARYLLTCNPLRAGIVEYPADSPWSSHRSKALGQANALIASHDVYLVGQLGERALGAVSSTLGNNARR